MRKSAIQPRRLQHILLSMPAAPAPAKVSEDGLAGALEDHDMVQALLTASRTVAVLDWLAALFCTRAYRRRVGGIWYRTSHGWLQADAMEGDPEIYGVENYTGGRDGA